MNSMKIVEIISDTLAEMDPANEAYYRENAASYLEELSALDEQFREIVSNGRHRMMVLADKFPLRYFADTYGLSYRLHFRLQYRYRAKRQNHRHILLGPGAGK